MALSDDEQRTFFRLMASLTTQQRHLTRLNNYYEGSRRLEQLGIAVPPALEHFETIVAWPRVTADSVEQRCDGEGFRIGPRRASTRIGSASHTRIKDADPAAGGGPPVDDDGQTADQEALAADLWDIWQANDLDEESQLGNLDAILFGRAYTCVGTRDPADPSIDVDDDIPLITVESPFEMIHESDRRTRRVTAALRRTDTDAANRTRYATLYLPDVTIWLAHEGSGGWVEQDRDEHKIGRPLVEPLLNRPRLRGRDGTSEIADVIGLTDAACRALTNAQFATEVLAAPQRYAIGVSQKDFVDQKTGEVLPAWEAYLGAIWALTSKDAKVGQFAAADLKNFETIVNHYANLVSGVSGLPTRFYGQYTTNPPSEGSIVADETRLIMNSYRKHRCLGGGYERTMRNGMRLVDGDWNPDLRRLEMLWRNPETPTRAQTADAAVKLFTARDPRGRPLLPREATWEELGYSATRRAQLKAMLRAEAAEDAEQDPIARAAAAFRPAAEPSADPNGVPTPPGPAPTAAAGPGRAGGAPAFSG